MVKPYDALISYYPKFQEIRESGEFSDDDWQVLEAFKKRSQRYVNV